MRLFYLVLFCFPIIATAQNKLLVDDEIKAYIQSKSPISGESTSTGTPGNGALKSGKLFPYKGKNYIYFDRDSYLAGRAFLHSELRKTVIQAYDSLLKVLPHRYFNIMECANEEGGKLFPHKTHQNGLSIDFMMPLIQNDKPYYGLDTIGTDHYMLRFDDQGKYIKDPTVEIDFNLVAFHLLVLDSFAKKNGLAISKVIIKIELKDELFSTKYGQLLKDSDIYVVQGLSPLVNALHDDHFHVDFKLN